MVSTDDRELKKHLLTCAECAAFARAEQAMCRDLETASADDNTDDIPLSELRTRVEARADSFRQAKTKEIQFMSAVIKQIRKRPSFGVTLGIAVVVLAFITLIPFSFDNTVGYEVAIAGVNKDLAMDSEKINELMSALGMEGVKVDVGDCEATCVLKISDLESEGEVDVVVAAFDELGNCVLEDISEIHDDETMTILQKAHKNMFISSADGPDGEEVHKIVIQALCHLDSASDGQFNVWITEGADTLICNNNIDGEGRNVIMIESGATAGDFVGDCDPIKVTTLDELEAGHAQLYVIGEDGNHRLIDMDDADAKMHLEKLGINIHEQAGAGSPHCIWISDDSCIHMLDEYLCDGDSNKIIIKKIGDCDGMELPDGHDCIITMNNTDDGEEVVVVDDNGDVHRINLNHPDAVEQLEALGFEVELTRDEDGEIATLTCTKDDGTAKIHIKRQQDGEEGEPELKGSVEEALPEGFELKQNYPNPFNPTTRISFTVPETQQVLLEIFNINGQKVRTLLDAVVNAGEFTMEWDSKDDNGERVASGIFTYRLTSGDIVVTKKMTLLK
jgi:hypothetical protein